MEYSGARILIECLKEQGVDTIFGYPGGANLFVYDELFLHRDEITHILTAHEQGAAHAAEGYAKASGKVGVCLATSGPGATNLVTGIADAYLDSVPIVAITCNVGLTYLGKDSFQEIDITGITMPITKHNFIVKDPKDLAPTLRRAFAIARSGRPGPVLVDIPKDVTALKADYEKVEMLPFTPTPLAIEEEDFTNAIAMIKAAKKPFILVGGGVILAEAAEAVKKFVDLVGAPVCDTQMGKGGFPNTSPLYTGMLGMHGTKTANLGVSECDLLITLGCRFSDRVTGNTESFAKNAKILQFDVDEAETNKNVLCAAALIGDLNLTLNEVNQRLEKLAEKEGPLQHEKWLAHIADYQSRFPLSYAPEGLSGPYIIEEIYRQTKGDAIITTEVGQHQMWAAQYFKYDYPRTHITSGGLGTMGFGLGASMGAKLAKPEKTVINIAGDGCFRMNLHELATAARFNIPIIEVIVNNHVLGMVRQWQAFFYEERYSNTTLADGVDFVKVAEGLGVKALRAKTREEFVSCFREALAHGGPIIIDCHVDQNDKVWPMVAPGKAINEAFDEADLIAANHV